jgi:4-hydroxybenzoate polyprenyltransferase
MNECECTNIYKKEYFRTQNIVENISKVKEVLFKEFIYGGHWLSLGVATFSVALMLLIGVTVKIEFLLIVYFLSQSVYNYDHFKWLKIDAIVYSKRSNYLSGHYNFIPFIILSYMSMFFLLLFISGNILSLIFGSFLLLIGIFYTKYSKRWTMKIPGFKNYYTSISASLLVIFIALYYSYPLNLAIWVLVLFVFLCFLVNTSFCDLKDIKADKKQNLKTLPLYFGEKKFLLILHILNILTFSILAYSIIIEILPFFASILLIFYFYCFYYIQKARSSTADLQLLSSYIADGEFILWPIFLILGNMFIFTF